MARAIKIYKDGEVKWTEEDRLTRFLRNGWTVEAGVSPEVTKEVQDDEEHWDPHSGEDWADSIESVVEDEMPNEEE
jgi:hypothetical protein